MAYRWGNNGKSDTLFSWAPKITAAMKLKDACSLEEKLWQTNLHSMSKETLLYQQSQSLVKAMVFPVVMYECASWTTNKGWTPKNSCFWAVVLEETLESPWTARRSNQSIPKEISPEYLLEELKLKLQYCGHLMQRTDSLEKTLRLGKIEGRRRRGRERVRWLDGIIDSMDMSFSKLQEWVINREAWHAAVHGVKKSQTWLSDWTELL